MTIPQRVLMICPSLELARLAERVSRENRFDLEIVVGSMDEALKAANRCKNQGLECIISRGPTGIVLRNNLSIPVLLVRIGAFDIFRAVFKASKISNKIAYFDHVHRMNIYDFQAMEEMLPNAELNYFFFCDIKMLAEELEIARREGIELVVAPDIKVTEMAKQKGLQSIIVESDYESVADAITRAKELIYLREKAQETSLFMKTIIDKFDEAILVLDGNYRIKHLNRETERMFGISYQQYLGKRFTHLPNIDRQLYQSLQDNYSLSNRIFPLRQKKVLVNTIPLSLNDSFKGQIIIIDWVKRIQQMEAKIRKELHAKGLVARYSFEDLIGKAPCFKKVIRLASHYARNDATVLITGESGTGKELFAHSIHQESIRKNGPFVSVNCSAIPENLLESELFGYNEGAFTGARKGGKPGIFELAHKGTLLLDEVSEIPLHLQARLLRVLQEKEVRRIGGEELVAVDCRIIASSNQLLYKMVQEGKFREDLFYRLNVLNLTIPPLRERVDDIRVLIKHFYDTLSGGRKLPQISSAAMNKLKAFGWPGNVRELENFVERLVVLTAEGISSDFVFILDNLIQELYVTNGEYLNRTDSDHLLIRIGTMQDMEQQIITKLYRFNHQNREELAKNLNISRTTLWKKLKEINSVLKSV